MGWGTLEVAVVGKGPVEARFGKFVDQVIARKIVPLLGSGVSLSKVDGVGAKSVTELFDLIRSLIPDVFNSHAPSSSDFAAVCEILYWRYGALKLCKTLKIEELSTIEPTRAHRYLALLACEGLIELAITTNYDCGLDKAYRQAKRPTEVGDWRPITSKGRWKRSTSGFQLFKINGCSFDYKESSTKTAKERKIAAESILLANFQINQFWSRRWVESRLTTTLFEKQLAFSGFGSDERQLWDTLLRVAHDVGERVDDEARFLWIISHEGKLNIWETQALIFENKARGRPTRGFRGIFDNVIGPELVGDPRGKLDAGDFWRLVWITALHRVLRDATRDVGRDFVVGVGRALTARVSEEHLSRLWELIVDDVFSDPYTGWFQERPGIPTAVAPDVFVTEFAGDKFYVSFRENKRIWLSLILSMFAVRPAHDATADGTTLSVRLAWDEGPVLSLEYENTDLRIGGRRPDVGIGTSSRIAPQGESSNPTVERVAEMRYLRLNKHDVFDMEGFSTIDFSKGLSEFRVMLRDILSNALSRDRPRPYGMYDRQGPLQ